MMKYPYSFSFSFLPDHPRFSTSECGNVENSVGNFLWKCCGIPVGNSPKNRPTKKCRKCGKHVEIKSPKNLRKKEFSTISTPPTTTSPTYILSSLSSLRESQTPARCPLPFLRGSGKGIFFLEKRTIKKKYPIEKRTVFRRKSLRENDI